MKFSVYKSSAQLISAANLAIENKLFVVCWGLIDDLNYISNFGGNGNKLIGRYKIVLCFSSGNPIAISLYNKLDRQLSTFVKPLYRNRGIAKQLTKLQNARSFWVGDGNKYSERFAKSVGGEYRSL